MDVEIFFFFLYVSTFQLTVLFSDVSRIGFDVTWAATGVKWRCVLIMANHQLGSLTPQNSSISYWLFSGTTFLASPMWHAQCKWHSLQRTCISLQFFNNCKAPQLLGSLSDFVWTAGIVNSWSYWNIIILQNIEKKNFWENNPILLGKGRNRKNSLIWEWFRGYSNCQVLHHDFNEMWQMWSRKLQML